MSIDERLSTEKITPELINYIVEKIVREIQPEKITRLGHTSGVTLKGIRMVSLKMFDRTVWLIYK